MIEYEELRIRLWRLAPARYVVLANGPACAFASTRIDPDVDLRRELLALIEPELHPPDGRDGVGEDDPPVRDESAEKDSWTLGERLFGMLFPGPVASCLARSADYAERNGRGLRLRFSLPPELCDLPLELLVAPQPHGRLVRQRRVSLVRTVRGLAMTVRRLPAPDSERGGFRVLVVAADPKGGGNGAGPADPRRLQLGHEVGALQELQRRFAGVQTEVLGWPQPAPAGARASLENIRATLERDPDMPTVVVILGHGIPAGPGRAGEVLLETKEGGAARVSGRSLAMAVADTAGVRLVVLNLCSGASPLHGDPRTGVGQEIVTQGVPAVVAMQTDVDDAVVAQFTPALLAAIARNDPVDEALSSARHKMVDPGATDTVSWASPVLLLHESCGHGWLFKAVEFAEDTDAGEKSDTGDWLADGAAAVDAVDHPRGTLRLDTLVRAGRFLRVQRRWDRVAGLIDLVPLNRDPGDVLRPLTAEARCELAADAVGRLVESLETPADGAQPVTLDDLAPLPDDVLAGLRAEIEQMDQAATDHQEIVCAASAGDWDTVERLCEQILVLFPDGFRDTLAHRVTARREAELARAYALAAEHANGGRWAEAEAAFEELGPYRDAPTRRWYCAGRRAEDDGDPARAAACFEKAGSTADAPGRRARMHCLVAQSREDWDEAARHAEEADRLGAIDPTPLAYVQARRAQCHDDWEQAVSLLSGLEPRYRDTRVRLRYVTGRAAVAREDWPGVIEGFGSLPDDHEDGAVGRFRRWARAMIAYAVPDWAAVLEALTGLDDSPAVTRLRLLAEGHVAAQADNWAGATAAWRQVDDPDPALRDLVRYGEGRTAEDDGRWDEALAAYDDVPDGLRDVPARRSYVRGRAAEDDGDWCAAVGHYAGLPAAISAAAQHAYALVRCALVRGAWAEAEAGVAVLGEHPEADVLRSYAQARPAEEQGRWADAAARYDACHSWSDAAGRAQYCRAREDEEHGRWSGALRRYETVGADVADVVARRDRLGRLLAVFPWADVFGDLTVVPDPAQRGSGSFPYDALAEIGIGPDSTVAEVKDAPMRALRKGDPALAEIATAMQTWERRLEVDTGLYPVHDPEGLRRGLTVLDLDGDADPFDSLCAALPVDAPLLVLWHRGRDDAVEAWRVRLSGDPGDVGSAHCLAIASRWAARELDEAGAIELGGVAWRRSIGCWAVVAGDDAYWERWRAARAVRYAFRIPPASLAAVRRNVLSGLRSELEEAAERHERDRRPSLAARYRTRTLDVRVESVGRELLGRVGGLPLGDDGQSSITCGPLLLQQLGLAECFAGFAASLVRCSEEEPGETGAAEAPAPELLADLRAAFSRLGPALALLDAERPGRALTALPDLTVLSISPDGNGSCGGREAREHPRPADCPECRAFLDGDPAYAFLAGREARLLQDAARLAVRGHLGTVSALLHDADDVGAAVAAVDAALTVGRRAGLSARARVEAAATVADVAGALIAGNGESPGGDRVDAVIAFLEGMEAVRLGFSERVQAVLAEARYARASRLDEIRAPDVRDFESAIADLRRAVAARPMFLMARATLVRQLVARVRTFPEAVDPVDAVLDAGAVADDGLRQAPGHEFLRFAMARTAELAQDLVYRSMTSAELVNRIRPTAGPAGPGAARVRSARELLFDAVAQVVADPGHAPARREFIAALRRWHDEGKAGTT